MNVFIACSSTKNNKRCKAKDMYTGDLFKKSWEYAESLHPDKIYILSGKHHLLDPDQIIEPYNLYIGDLSQEDRKKWADEVYKEMKSHHINFEAKTYFLAGEDYIEYLRDYFPNRKEMYGDGIGKIMHKLDRFNNRNENLVSLSNYIKESLY